MCVRVCQQVREHLVEAMLIGLQSHLRVAVEGELDAARLGLRTRLLEHLHHDRPQVEPRPVERHRA